MQGLDIKGWRVEGVLGLVFGDDGLILARSQVCLGKSTTIRFLLNCFHSWVPKQKKTSVLSLSWVDVMHTALTSTSATDPCNSKGGPCSFVTASVKIWLKCSTPFFTCCYLLRNLSKSYSSFKS